MKFLFKCPLCHNDLEADTEWCGQEIQCPCCSGNIIIPTPEPPKKSGKKWLVFTIIFLLAVAIAGALIFFTGGSKPADTPVAAKPAAVPKAPVAAKPAAVPKAPVAAKPAAVPKAPVAAKPAAPAAKVIKYPFRVMHNSGVPRIEKIYDGVPANLIGRINWEHLIENNDVWTVRFLLERNYLGLLQKSFYATNANVKNYRNLVMDVAISHPESITLLAFLLENSERFGMKITEWNKVYHQLLMEFRRRENNAYMLPFFGYMASYGITGPDFYVNGILSHDFTNKNELIFIRNNPPVINKNAPIVFKRPPVQIDMKSNLPPIKIPQNKVFDNKRRIALIQSIPQFNKYYSASELDNLYQKLRSAIEQGLDINDTELWNHIMTRSLGEKNAERLLCFMIENGADPKLSFTDNKMPLLELLLRTPNWRRCIIYLVSKGAPVTARVINQARWTKEDYELLMQLRSQSGPYWDDHML